MITQLKEKFDLKKYLYFDRIQFNRIFDKMKVPDLESSDYLFVFMYNPAWFYDKLYTLITYQLSLKNIPAVFLFKNDLINPHLHQLKVNGKVLSNTLNYRTPRLDVDEGTQHEKLIHEWKIDFKNEIAECQGINYFFHIYCNLRTHYMRYNLDFSKPDVQENAMRVLRSADLMIQYFNHLKHYAQATNKKIRIVGREQNYVPLSILMTLCQAKVENQDIEYIDIASGFMHYFGRQQQNPYICFANCTRKSVSSRFGITKDELEKYKENSDLSSIGESKSIKKAISKLSFQMTPRKESIINRLKSDKENGRQIFCLFAHIFYDVDIYDNSKCFPDMCTWIDETLDYFKNHPEKTLVLKPHPWEIHPSAPNKEPKETLNSFLGNRIQSLDNVILLEPREFTIPEIAPLIDCGIIWRSDVALELTFLNCPCLIGGEPHYKEAINFNYARSKEEYFNALESNQTLRINEEVKNEINLYLDYLEHDKHVCIPHMDLAEHRYYRWDKRHLDTFLENGHPAFEKIIENLL